MKQQSEYFLAFGLLVRRNKAFEDVNLSSRELSQEVLVCFLNLLKYFDVFRLYVETSCGVRGDLCDKLFLLTVTAPSQVIAT